MPLPCGLRSPFSMQGVDRASQIVLYIVHYLLAQNKNSCFVVSIGSIFQWSERVGSHLASHWHSGTGLFVKGSPSKEHLQMDCTSGLVVVAAVEWQDR